MTSGTKQIKTVNNATVRAMKIKWKPRCPMCGTPFNIVYDDAGDGHINEKCRRCNKIFLLTLSSQEIQLIIE